MKIEELEFNITAEFEQSEIYELPQGMVDCYNGLCKYTKPEKAETSVCYEINDLRSRVSMYITVYSDYGEFYSTYFDEGKDFNLSDTEKEALISKMMELAIQSRTA